MRVGLGVRLGEGGWVEIDGVEKLWRVWLVGVVCRRLDSSFSLKLLPILMTILCVTCACDEVASVEEIKHDGDKAEDQIGTQVLGREVTMEAQIGQDIVATRAGKPQRRHCTNQT